MLIGLPLCLLTCPEIDVLPRRFGLQYSLVVPLGSEFLISCGTASKEKTPDRAELLPQTEDPPSMR